MGGGRGSGGVPSRSTVPLKSKADIVAKKIEDKSDLTNLKNKEDEIKKFVEEEMNKASDKVPWDHNDHSTKHIERVLEKFPEIIDNFEKISFSKEFLSGENLSDLDREILKYAIILHDIGYSKSIKDHSLLSKEYIEKLNRGIKKSILTEIATIAQLHTPEGIKQLGGKSLSNLVEKGHISDRIAYLTSILIISDALDAGKQRTMQNSQGETRSKVIEKIQSKYSTSVAESKLEHWYGHQGFSNPILNKSDNRLTLSVELDIKLSDQHSSKIAFRVLDIITDITSSYLSSSSKFKLDLNIASKNKEVAKKWFNENKLIFENEKNLSKKIKFTELNEG